MSVRVGHRSSSTGKFAIKKHTRNYRTVENRMMIEERPEFLYFLRWFEMKVKTRRGWRNIYKGKKIYEASKSLFAIRLLCSCARRDLVSVFLGTANLIPAVICLTAECTPQDARRKRTLSKDYFIAWWGILVKH